MGQKGPPQMTFAAAAASLAERAPLPDFVIRAGMRRVIAANDACVTPPGTDAAFARAMAGKPIAEHADAANRQHYELPPEFFALFCPGAAFFFAQWRQPDPECFLAADVEWEVSVEGFWPVLLSELTGRV